MPISKNLFAEHLSDCMVETGSYMGDGIRNALDAGFPAVRSVELSPQFYEIARGRFAREPRVRVYLGDSGDILWDVIGDVDGRITFWLDGHWSGGQTALGPVQCPLRAELDAIARHPRKDHTILIDDMRCWVKDDPGIGFGEEDIREWVLAINPAYTFSRADGHVPDDILVCTVPVLAG